ncbi:MAG: glycerol-3-phosphate acyltransferase PlsX [Verrucomicrobiales bacterium]|jgi:glycerol-3-phosphate acyltransferase PlsX
MKIAIDAMGGDFAPENVVAGAKLALESIRRIDKLYLAGPEAQIKAQVDAQRLPAGRIEIVDAPEIVEMNESGAKAVRRKKKSSISVATDLVKDGTCAAVMSAGNTGAAVAAATVKLRNLAGVERAGIASPIPNEHGTCNIIDAGANPEAKAKHLLQYGIMGSVYAKYALGVDSPKIGLMSVGTEDEKGTEFTREVFSLLKGSQLNFIGNVEGHDLFEKPIDVVVCDGFVGNVVLKSCEATAHAMFKWLRAELTASPVRMLGAKLAKGAFKAVKHRASAESYGGCPLLGVNGVCIIAHGSSSPTAIMNAVRIAAEAVAHEVNPHIEEEIARHKVAAESSSPPPVTANA